MPIATANATASSSRKRVNRAEEDDEEDRAKPTINQDGRVVEEGWTLETFVNKPIEKNNATQALLRGLSEKLKTILTRIEEGMQKIKEAAKAIEDASPEDPMSKELADSPQLIYELEKELLRSIEQTQIVQIKIDVLGELDMELRQNKPLEINHDDEACPPVSSWLPRSADDESDDEDFEMGGTTQTYRCPMTLRPFEEAMTCIICKHSYSKMAIYGLIDQVVQGRGGRKETKCPLPGCQAKITKDNLKPDKELQRRTDEFERRKKRREEQDDESDDDVDISQD